MQAWANANKGEMVALRSIPSTAALSTLVQIMKLIKATGTHIHIRHMYGIVATNSVWAVDTAGMHRKGYALLMTSMSGLLGHNDAAFQRAIQGYLVVNHKPCTESGGARGKNFQARWDALNTTLYPSAGPGSTRKLDYRNMLEYDAVFTIAHAIHAAFTAGALTIPVPPTVHNSLPRMSSGNVMSSYMQRVDFLGVTGRVNFDASGTRANPEVLVYNLNGTATIQVGRYTAAEGLFLLASKDISWPGNTTAERLIKPSDGISKSAELLILVPGPYDRKRVSSKLGTNGNADFGGYSIMIFNEIAKRAGIKIKYKMYCTTCPGSGGWSGMISAVQQGKAHGAAGTITITSARTKMVTFSLPFLDEGLVLLVRKSEEKNSSVFWGFLYPFSSGLWSLWLITTLVLATVFSYVECESRGGSFQGKWMDRFSESTWFSLCCLFYCGEQPMNTLRGRMLFWAWCLTTMVLVASYTANTASFLTAASLSGTKISGVNDLQGKTVAAKIENHEWEVLKTLGLSAELRASSSPVESVRSEATVAGAMALGSFLDDRHPKYCSVNAVLPSLQPEPFGFAINNEVANVFMPEINSALMAMQIDGTVSSLIQGKRGPVCPTTGDKLKLKGGNSLTVDNFTGLWLITVVIPVAVIVVSQYVSDLIWPPMDLMDLAADCELLAQQKTDTRRQRRALMLKEQLAASPAVLVLRDDVLAFTKKAFARYDHDESGYIDDVDEFAGLTEYLLYVLRDQPGDVLNREAVKGKVEAMRALRKESLRAMQLGPDGYVDWFMQAARLPKAEATPRKSETETPQLISQYFRRYDLDLSGTINSHTELQQLCMNLCVRLELGFGADEIEEKLVGAGNMEELQWTLEQFSDWFVDEFNVNLKGTSF